MQTHHDVGPAPQVPSHHGCTPPVATSLLHHPCEDFGGFAAGHPRALHYIGVCCLKDAFTPAQPDSCPFCLQGESRPAGCTVTFHTPPDVPLSRAAQGIGREGKEAETAPPKARAAQGTPGMTLSCPSPAQVTLAGRKARQDWLCAAEGWCVAAPSPLTQVMLANWMIYDEVPAARCDPEMIKMRTFGNGSG